MESYVMLSTGKAINLKYGALETQSWSQSRMDLPRRHLLVNTCKQHKNTKKGTFTRRARLRSLTNTFLPWLSRVDDRHRAREIWIGDVPLVMNDIFEVVDRTSEFNGHLGLRLWPF